MYKTRGKPRGYTRCHTIIRARLDLRNDLTSEDAEVDLKVHLQCNWTLLRLKVGKFMRVCDIETIMFDALAAHGGEASCLQSAQSSSLIMWDALIIHRLDYYIFGSYKVLDRHALISPTQLAVSTCCFCECHHRSPARRLAFVKEVSKRNLILSGRAQRASILHLIRCMEWSCRN